MKKDLGDTLADAMGVSKEIIMNIPHITLAGNREIYIENYKGILKYSEDSIFIATAIGVLKIIGKNLLISMVRKEDIFISGEFFAIEFEK